MKSPGKKCYCFNKLGLDLLLVLTKLANVGFSIGELWCSKDQSIPLTKGKEGPIKAEGKPL